MRNLLRLLIIVVVFAAFPGSHALTKILEQPLSESLGAHELYPGIFSASPKIDLYGILMHGPGGVIGDPIPKKQITFSAIPRSFVCTAVHYLCI